MRIKAMRGWIGREGRVRAGEVVDVDDARAAELIDRGRASKHVERQSAGAGIERETRDVGPEETKDAGEGDE